MPAAVLQPPPARCVSAPQQAAASAAQQPPAAPARRLLWHLTGTDAGAAAAAAAPALQGTHLPLSLPLRCSLQLERGEGRRDGAQQCSQPCFQNRRRPGDVQLAPANFAAKGIPLATEAATSTAAAATAKLAKRLTGAAPTPSSCPLRSPSALPARPRRCSVQLGQWRLRGYRR